MTCVYCGEKTTVEDTKKAPDEIIRRRKCLGCGKIFYTAERDIDSKLGRKLMYQYTKRSCSR